MNEYIHEYDFYDEMVCAIDDANREVVLALNMYKKAQRKCDTMCITENVDTEAFMTEATDNVFARIGKAVMNLLEKIKKFFVDIADKIRGHDRVVQNEINEIQALMVKDPSIARARLTEGISNGTFKGRDISTLVNEVESAQKLYEMNKLDEDTFSNKVRKSFEKCDKFLKPIAGTLLSIGAIIAFFPTLVKSMGNIKEIISKIQRNMREFKANIGRKQLTEPNKVVALWRSFQELIGISTAEYKDRVNFLQALGKILKKFRLNAVGDKLINKGTERKAKGLETLAERNADYKIKTDKERANKKAADKAFDDMVDQLVKNKSSNT